MDPIRLPNNAGGLPNPMHPQQKNKQPMGLRDDIDVKRNEESQFPELEDPFENPDADHNQGEDVI